MGEVAERRRKDDRPRLTFRVLTAALYLAIAALLPAAFPSALQQPWLVIGWVALLSASTLMHLTVSTTSQVEITLRLPVTIASAVVLDPPLALLVNLLSFLGLRELQPGVSVWRILYNRAQFGLIAYVASLAAVTQRQGIIAATLIAVPLCDLLNLTAVVVGQSLSGRCSFREAVRGAAVPFPHFATSYVLTLLIALLMVLLYQDVGWWSVGLLAVPLYLGYAAMRSAKTADERANELTARVRELEVLHALGTGLLSAPTEYAVLELGIDALRVICDGDVMLASNGPPPAHLQERILPGTNTRVWVPVDLEGRRAAEVETICSAIGLALQRLVVGEKLREAQRAQAELAEGILTEGTAARSRVALNVHDDVLPYLAAATIQAENVVTAIEIGDGLLATNLAHRVRDGVSGGIAALRTVLDDLQRQTIVPGDLVPSIRRAADQARVDHGVTVTLDTEGFDGRLSHPVEILLTETITGLLTNVVRHAQASSASIRVCSEDGSVIAEVCDDGVGFDPDDVGAGHHGLVLMRQRAEIAQGEFRIDSGEDGTKVYVRVPTGTVRGPSVLGQPEQPKPRQPDAPAVVREAAVR